MPRLPRFSASPKALRALALAAVLALPAGGAPAQSPEAEIRAALAQWTEDFNAGRADKVCGLFSRDLRADVRSAPPRDFALQCDVLRRALANPKLGFAYRHDIRDIVVEGRLAAVRIVWTTQARDKASGRTETTIDDGLDVFRREDDGRWRIIRYMAWER